ncbi:uncharacterized protein LOC129411219 isoform X2 [Boleophthalmus pectinirostris]|uniref:uncharacterized protein LOC129411219 isoform X2 n=1 Tax=Boleophthalmus pectinirostris TaxID=150288 RepID=UPI00242E6CB5|nr:uncharacterized protein LOC129411219 isoform X2 [Boleophthalmus pectinirostris]
MPSTFYSELDRHIPRLMALFRQKASRTGKTADALANILKIHDEQALPVYLREDVSGFFITCTVKVDEPVFGVAVGLLTVISDHNASPVHYHPRRVSVIVEGDVVVSLPRLGEAFMVVFGLVYALHFRPSSHCEFVHIVLIICHSIVISALLTQESTLHDFLLFIIKPMMFIMFSLGLIRRRFGQKGVKALRHLERLEKARARYNNHLRFNLRCRDENITPASINIKTPIPTHNAKQIVNKAKKALFLLFNFSMQGSGQKHTSKK